MLKVIFIVKKNKNFKNCFQFCFLYEKTYLSLLLKSMNIKTLKHKSIYVWADSFELQADEFLIDALNVIKYPKRNNSKKKNSRR